ncbi:hypothetical protein BGW36DRAFT_205991 [Talaromyces proteolyticus]|uniref:Uncharacterized protein n=1 Tax=Talaromyces proteolyticus TaxID=1131652 RepID=A0AAD4KM62_9EURO|nr:uncharacterized protein BGW36DRAFT_205991 [Talaromyces proteolyticus]KAH8695689.1 hypothetical protein BGW36DRAFT_205991 [Talaromyces proteolyticus]
MGSISNTYHRMPRTKNLIATNAVLPTPVGIDFHAARLSVINENTITILPSTLRHQKKRLPQSSASAPSTMEPSSQTKEVLDQVRTLATWLNDVLDEDYWRPYRANVDVEQCSHPDRVNKIRPLISTGNIEVSRDISVLLAVILSAFSPGQRTNGFSNQISWTLQQISRTNIARNLPRGIVDVIPRRRTLSNREW